MALLSNLSFFSAVSHLTLEARAKAPFLPALLKPRSKISRPVKGSSPSQIAEVPSGPKAFSLKTSASSLVKHLRVVDSEVAPGAPCKWEIEMSGLSSTGLSGNNGNNGATAKTVVQRTCILTRTWRWETNQFVVLEVEAAQIDKAGKSLGH